VCISTITELQLIGIALSGILLLHEVHVLPTAMLNIKKSSIAKCEHEEREKSYYPVQA